MLFTMSNFIFACRQRYCNEACVQKPGTLSIIFVFHQFICLTKIYYIYLVYALLVKGVIFSLTNINMLHTDLYVHDFSILSTLNAENCILNYKG